MIQTILNFFRAGTAESSKRLLSILSYLVSLGLAIFCVVHGFPLEGNVLALLLGLTGVATANQAFNYGKEAANLIKPKDDDNDKQ